MMFFWVPLFFVPLVLIWAFHGEARHGCATHYYGPAPAPQSNPVEIARVRLARGEITVEEYDTIRRVLG